VLFGIDEDEDLERMLLANSPKLRAILDAADRRIDAGAGIGHDEFWRQMEAGGHSPKRKGSAKDQANKQRG
jgi:hypothetical protein